MNTYLKTLFEKYRVSDRNRHEILQIWTLLPDEKRKNLLNNFEVLIIRLTKIEEEVRVEREVLIGKAVTKIERIITEDKKKKRSSKKTRQEIDILKNEI